MVVSKREFECSHNGTCALRQQCCGRVRSAVLKLTTQLLEMFKMTHRTLLTSRYSLKASTAIDLFNYLTFSKISYMIDISNLYRVNDAALRDIRQNDCERDFSNLT